MLGDETLNLIMREADVAIWFNAPTQQDLVRRKLFTAHYHVYASNEYIKRFGRPKSLGELDKHRIMTYGGPMPSPFKEMNWLEMAGRDGQGPREPALRINSLVALREAVAQGLGIAVLPDYLAKDYPRIHLILDDIDMPVFDVFFVYPEDLKDTARVNAFRDFVVAKSREWSF